MLKNLNIFILEILFLWFMAMTTAHYWFNDTTILLESKTWVSIDFWTHYIGSIFMLIIALIVIFVVSIIIYEILKYLYIKISWYFKDKIYDFRNK